MFMAILIFLPLSFIRPKLNSRGLIHKINFWWFVSTFLMLLWLGSQHVEYPFTDLSLTYSINYFLLCLVHYC